MLIQIKKSIALDICLYVSGKFAFTIYFLLYRDVLSCWLNSIMINFTHEKIKLIYFYLLQIFIYHYLIGKSLTRVCSDIIYLFGH